MRDLKHLLIVLASMSLLICAGVDHTKAQDDPAGEAQATAEKQEAPQQEAAEEAGDDAQVSYDSGNLAWMMVSVALVLMMTGPGLALFYGGLVRKKNILSVMMQCLFLMGMNSVLWALIGYSLAFSEGGPVFYTHGETEFTLFGGMDHLFLEGVSPYLAANGKDVIFPSNGALPAELFMLFQMMFFVITPALIAGAFAERMKFSAMVLFTILWGLIIYCPLAHWVWGPHAIFGGGSPIHALDFAGGLVVHASSGVSALICALVIGKRLGYPKEPIPPHNLTYTVIGACLLWVGWFGFNAGSELASDAMAVNAMVVTHLSAAAGVLGWAGIEWLVHGKPSVLGACSGAVAGLVVITPASGFVTPMPAIVMGLIAGVVCYYACAKVKVAFGYDDSLDAFGIHGVGGSVGAILTGLFASPVLVEGLERGHQVLNQAISVVVTVIFAAVGSFIILKVVDALVGLRVSEAAERRGLDVSEHDEEGYIFT